MQIKPLGKSRFRPVTLLVPGWRQITALTPDGSITAKGQQNCFKLLESLQFHNLYVSHSLKDLLQTTGSNHWQAEMWKGHVTTMSLDGTKVKVHSLRRILDSVTLDVERYEAFLELTTWLNTHGVAPGSISAMAWSLWRSTLKEEFSLSFDSTIGRSAFYGGRQEAVQGEIYKNMVALDIASAYPFEMASKPYAGTLREVSTRTELDPNQPGLATAKVFIPDSLPHSPLPTRVSTDVIQWKKGELQGTWTWQELAAAKDLGCKIEIQRCWAPLTLVEPFGEWWDVVREGRANLNPPAAKLVKSLSNSLWGMFGMTGDSRGVVRWLDAQGNKPEMIDKRSKNLPQSNTAHIAAETTSRVRTRMLLEGLYGGQSLEPNFPVHIDTDGVIMPQEALQRFSDSMIGVKSGQWRVKTEMYRLEVKAPQMYRYQCGQNCLKEHKNWHYVASGMTASQAHRYFERGNAGIGISLGAVGSEGVSSGYELDKKLAEL